MLKRGAACALLPAVFFLAVGCGGAKKKIQKTEAELYQQAETYMAAKKYSKAINTFEKIRGTTNKELQAQIHLRLADAYFERKNILNLAEAQARYQSFLNAYPVSNQAPYAQYRFSLCLKKGINKPDRDQTPTYRAIAEFAKVEVLYPSSPWVAEAKLRLEELQDHLSEDAMKKARFYYRRKRFKAASSRLREILRDNPDYPGRDEVLFYLGMALRRSGKIAEGNLYLERLVSDFPDTKLGRKASARLATPIKLGGKTSEKAS